VLSRRRPCCCGSDEPPYFGTCLEYWLRCVPVGAIIKVRARCTKTIYEVYQCDTGSISDIPYRSVIEFDMVGEVKFNPSAVVGAAGCFIYGSSSVVASMATQTKTILNGTPEGCFIYADCIREYATVQGPGGASARYGTPNTAIPHIAEFGMFARCQNPPNPSVSGSWTRDFVGTCSGTPPQVIPGCFAGADLSASFSISSKEMECDFDPQTAYGSVTFADGSAVPLEFQDYQLQLPNGIYISNTGSVTVEFV